MLHVRVITPLSASADRAARRVPGLMAAIVVGGLLTLLAQRFAWRRMRG